MPLDWRREWTERRLTLRVRGDSVAMLTVVLKLKAATNAALGIIAREIALDLAESPFPPDIRASHLPGITNVVANVLSRRYSPSTSSQPWTPPQCLRRSKEARPEPRGSEYFRTLLDHPPRQVRK